MFAFIKPTNYLKYTFKEFLMVLSMTNSVMRFVAFMHDPAFKGISWSHTGNVNIKKQTGNGSV